jgi:hypothetical protein
MTNDYLLLTVQSAGLNNAYSVCCTQYGLHQIHLKCVFLFLFIRYLQLGRHPVAGDQ